MTKFYTAGQAQFRLTASNSSWLTSLAGSGRSRALFVSIALAMAVNKMSDLPGGKLDDQSPDEFFMKNAGVAGAEVVGVINELLPVDYKTALAVGKGLYINRYENAYMPYQEFGTDRSHGLAAIFGLNYHFSEDVLNCMRTESRAVIETYERFVEIIRELTKE